MEQDRELKTEIEKAKPSKLRKIIILLAFIFVGVGIYVMFFMKQITYDRTAAMDDVVKKLPTDTSIKFKTNANQGLKVSLDDLVVFDQGKYTTMILDLSAQTKFGAKRSEDERTYTVTLYNTIEGSTFQPDLKSQSASDLDLKMVDNDLELKFTLEPNVSVNEIAFANDESSNLIIKFLLRGEAGEQVATGVNVKKVANTKSATELSNEFYQKSLDLANVGNILGAFEKSKKAIAYRQDNHDARKMYILSALELGRRKDAEQALEKGMFLAPNMLNYKKIKAKLLLADNKPQKALEILLSARPNIQKEASYYAFIAAVRQKLGDHDKAIKIYLKLLKLFPNEGEWWAGLGVSFDSLDDSRQALSAYTKAVENGGLDIELENYVEGRIQELK